MTGSVRASLRFTSPTIGAVIVLFAGHPCEPTARACDTPVYRYAMYNWAPSPYRVYYFCQGEPDKKDAEVNRLLAEQSSGAQRPLSRPRHAPIAGTAALGAWQPTARQSALREPRAGDRGRRRKRTRWSSFPRRSRGRGRKTRAASCRSTWCSPRGAIWSRPSGWTPPPCGRWLNPRCGNRSPNSWRSVMPRSSCCSRERTRRPMPRQRRSPAR